ncbi:MAG: hypothetical protein ACETVR_00700, partial [Candidatus Bathyarchaeia archaeon]
KPSLHEKIEKIEHTFAHIAKQIKSIKTEHLFLNIHLSYFYRSQFFGPINISSFKELVPNPENQIKVITLIDDVFVIWQTLKKREKEGYPGTSLRLREILAWRSVEMMQAEALALIYTTEERSVNNYLLSIRHPFETFYNLIFREPVCGVYLSFPITNTRYKEECIKEINEFRKGMHESCSKKGAVVFDPVTIDELALNYAREERETRVLDSSVRWPLEIESLVKEPDWPIEIPNIEVVEAIEDIENNIGTRDFKMIDSSRLTAVYRPNWGGLSKGVYAEKRYTLSRGKRLYVYDPEEDTPRKDVSPFEKGEIGFRNVEEFYENIHKDIDRSIKS